jgi:hypothetical protein
MMHTIRLLQSCEHIFKTNSLEIRVETVRNFWTSKQETNPMKA